MDNIKIIETILQALNEAIACVESWKTKPAVAFEEQKKVAGLLTHLLSVVWALDAVEVRAPGAHRPATGNDKQHLHDALQALKNELSEPSAPAVAPVETTKPEMEPDESFTLEWEEEAPKETTIPEAAPVAPAPVSVSTPAPAAPPVSPPAPAPASAPPPAPPPPPAVFPSGNKPVRPDKKKASPPPFTRSLFDVLSKYDKDEPALYTPIRSLSEAIGLNDKYLFVRELFNNNEKEFAKTLVRLDNMSDLEEAQNYYSTSVLTEGNRNSYAAKQFGSLLIRRYMSR